MRMVPLRLWDVLLAKKDILVGHREGTCCVGKVKYRPGIERERG